jgi:excisionase family DNA binding protein
MTAIAAERGLAAVRPWNWARERLMSLPAAARRLGWDASTVRDWVRDSGIPVVRTPGGHMSLYESWVTAVLGSARPGRPGDMSEVTRQWWAERGETEEVAA